MSKVKNSTSRKTRNANAGQAQNGYWHGYPIEAVKLSDIKPYDKNPRKNDKAVPAVVASIKAVGFINPIVIDSNNTIINGHTRRLAAIQLKMTEVPCIRPKDLTEQQVRLLRIADNKVSELSNWDYELLDRELDALEENFDLGDFGFSEPNEQSQNSDNGNDIENYSILVKCKNANDCERVYNELVERGYECQISTL